MISAIILFLILLNIVVIFYFFRLNSEIKSPKLRDDSLKRLWELNDRDLLKLWGKVNNLKPYIEAEYLFLKRDIERINKEVIDLHKKDSLLQAQINRPSPYVIGKKYKYGIYAGHTISDIKNSLFCSTERVHKFKNGDAETVIKEVINSKAEGFTTAINEAFNAR